MLSAVRIFIGFIVVYSLEMKAFALSCKDVRELIFDNYLKYHLTAKGFTTALSDSTLKNFVTTLDPGKVYFLQKDIDLFMKKYNRSLPEMIRKSDCSAIDVVFSLYTRRFEERQVVIDKYIKAQHNFKIEESVNFDRKVAKYAKNSSEIEERWRKRIKFQHLQLMESLDDVSKVPQKLVKRYQLLKKQQKEMTTDEVYGAFLDAFSSALDPHTDYYSPSQLEEFRINTRLSLEGIGALLRSEYGVTTVQSLIIGGAAQKGGRLKVNDKIVAVAQSSGTPVDVIDMDLRDVVKLIRGAEGTEVKLSVRREDKVIVVPIIREKVHLKDRATKSKIYEVQTTVKKKHRTYKVGVIDLPSFYIDFEGRNANRRNFRSSSRDMLVEINKLKKADIDGIIVDLRSNGGGSLDEAINVAGLFDGEGPVVQTKGAGPKVHVSNYREPASYDGPLIVLIDSQSASASEILAGAIKDFERGLILGDRQSFGKGSVQSLNDISRQLGAIKVTVSRFYRPSGSSTQLKGVASDITIPSLIDQYEIGEKHYDYALPWNQVAKAEHKNFKLVQPYVKQLSNRSQARVKSNKDFGEINKAISKYLEKKKDRMTVSLKEKSAEDKKKEKAEEEKRAAEEVRDDAGSLVVSIDKDPILKESVYVMADYIRVLKNKPLDKLKLVVRKDKVKK